MDPTLRPQYYQPFKMQTAEYHHHIIRKLLPDALRYVIHSVTLHRDVGHALVE